MKTCANIDATTGSAFFAGPSLLPGVA